LSFYEHSKKNWLFSSLWKNAQKPDFLNLSKIGKPCLIDLGIFFNGFRICFFRKKYFQTDCDLEKKWPFDSLRQPILRKRYSVWGSVEIIEEIILYYSTCKKEFWVTPKFEKDTKSQGKRCIIGPFKQRSNGKIMYKYKYMISLTERTCICGSSQEFRKGFI